MEMAIIAAKKKIKQKVKKNSLDDFTIYRRKAK